MKGNFHVRCRVGENPAITSKDYLSLFKNLFVPTKLQNVSGISNSASQKALDLFLKCRYLDETTGGKGLILATGTPLSNSITELHTMMRYLEYDFLRDHGLQHFDNWIAVFGEQKSDWELRPAGNGITVNYGLDLLQIKRQYENWLFFGLFLVSALTYARALILFFSGLSISL